MSDRARIRRLNWGCGEDVMPGWINSDAVNRPHVDIACDIRDGLPLNSDSVDYAASVHALNDIPYPDVAPVLKELRRVLKPKGVLRLVLPDLDKGIQAYLAGDRDYFLVSDRDQESLGGKLIVHLLWYGHTRTLFTYDFIEELLVEAGFAGVVECGYKQTPSSYSEIVELDNRERESLFVEATK